MIDEIWNHIDNLQLIDIGRNFFFLLSLLEVCIYSMLNNQYGIKKKKIHFQTNQPWVKHITQIQRPKKVHFSICDYPSTIYQNSCIFSNFFKKIFPLFISTKQIITTKKTSLALSFVDHNFHNFSNQTSYMSLIVFFVFENSNNNNNNNQLFKNFSL